MFKFDSEFHCPIVSTCMEFGSNFSIQKDVSQIKEKTSLQFLIKQFRLFNIIPIFEFKIRAHFAVPLYQLS
jgi:hypothetical protein